MPTSVRARFGRVEEDEGSPVHRSPLMISELDFQS
jgi:hypothetical protein